VRTNCSTDVWVGRGILRAVREDISKGHLQTLRELVHADVFTDFLEMTQYFLTNGYKDPAAVMVGGVLEEHLRLLCRKHDIDVEVQSSSGLRPKKADAMNADLAKAGVYSRLDQKSVTAWLDLRNSAAHGNHGDYNTEQVKTMVQSVRDLMARHPA
jgi:hypothetical protein